MLKRGYRGPFYWQKLTGIVTVISDNIHSFLWDVINHPCPIFNGSLVKPQLKLQHVLVITWHYFTWILLLPLLQDTHSNPEGIFVVNNFRDPYFMDKFDGNNEIKFLQICSHIMTAQLFSRAKKLCKDQFLTIFTAVKHKFTLNCYGCKFLKWSGLTQTAKFTGPTWGPPWSCWPQMGLMLAPWT